ncbi:thiamine pyrophosphate-dependent acetolactate synthase large subunit-like protein [Pseudorhizobium tarimense]|uniref:Thiamine pyrophosphate-dependent acetolactate synthase large subunit-like protein n=1 Tax=Pseudorhizobium tarimense TaxID=1079109 RepID=A0ABV2HDW0_9HYPH
MMEGDPKFEASQRIPNVPYHKFAELIGLGGIYVGDPKQVSEAWQAAITADWPIVLEVQDPS